MKILNFILLFLIYSCTVGGQEITLEGKIAIEDSNGKNGTVYIPTARSEFALRYDKEVHFSGLHWANTTDSFVGIEYFSNKIGRIIRGNVVRLDLKGNIIDTVYKSREGELTGNAYLSENDNKLLFTLKTDGKDEGVWKQFNRPVSIVIVDPKSKTIIKKIDDVGLSSTVDINESPWLNNEVQFIYDIASGRRVIVKGENEAKSNEKDAGVYIYDLKTDRHSLLVKSGHYGIASPADDRIAYIKENKIWIYDLKSRREKVLYVPNAREEINHIHWAPGGEYIYLTYIKQYDFGFFSSDAKFLRIDNGSQVAFQRIDRMFNNYTWKR